MGGPTTPYLPPLECTRLDDLKHTHHSAALLRAQLLDDAVEYPHPITPVLELGAWPHDVTWLGVGVGVGLGLGLGLGYSGVKPHGVTVCVLELVGLVVLQDKFRLVAPGWG